MNSAFCALTEAKFLLSAQISTGTYAGKEDDKLHVLYRNPTTTLMPLLRPLAAARPPASLVSSPDP